MLRRVLAISLFAALVPQFAFAEAPLDRTNVRVIGSPQGVFKRSSAIVLSHVEVTARNVGTSQAKGVQVAVVLPGGDKVAMKGPDVLEPNKSATYTADPSARINSTEKLRAEAHCSNCW